MKTLFFLLVLTTCAFPVALKANSNTVGWWFSPDSIEDLPVELEEDDNGYWNEVWLRPGVDSTVSPNEVMEQALGARWVGLNPDRDGKPTQVVLALAGQKVVEFKGENAKTGNIQDDKIVWDDKSTDPLVAYRRRRRRKSAKVNFGKIVLPPLASRTKTLSPWSVERLPVLLSKLSSGPESLLTARDFSALAQIDDANGSFLNFRYDDSCSGEARAKIEDALAFSVDAKLTCWMSQNNEGSSKLLAALLQRPIISCNKQNLPKDACGAASVPRVNGFFVREPKIHVALDRCKGELGQTMLHEVLHLAGLTDKDIIPALEASESCAASPASLQFENENEGFFNDFEVQTRIFIFRKVRDEALEKWHWRPSERDFMLGTICTQMGDKYCSRNYFQKAAEEGLQGLIELPEGSQVSWSALAQFEFYDAVTEDLQRMHELARYLRRDPNGSLLRRIETGVHRLHEFFVARQALEAVKNNKGICSSETDEHVLCEDLAEIKKTPWFNHP